MITPGIHHVFIERIIKDGIPIFVITAREKYNFGFPIPIVVAGIILDAPWRAAFRRW
jgi:hypothetical protein